MTAEEALWSGAPPGFEVYAGIDQQDEKQLFRRIPIVSSDEITEAWADFHFFKKKQPVVRFRFNAAATRNFGDFTTRNTHHSFAIVLDGRAILVLRIMEPLLRGIGEIDGGLRQRGELTLRAMCGRLIWFVCRWFGTTKRDHRQHRTPTEPTHLSGSNRPGKNSTTVPRWRQGAHWHTMSCDGTRPGGTVALWEKHAATLSPPHLPSVGSGPLRGLDGPFEMVWRELPEWDCIVEARAGPLDPMGAMERCRRQAPPALSLEMRRFAGNRIHRPTQPG